MNYQEMPKKRTHKSPAEEQRSFREHARRFKEYLGEEPKPRKKRSLSKPKPKNLNPLANSHSENPKQSLEQSKLDESIVG